MSSRYRSLAGLGSPMVFTISTTGDLTLTYGSSTGADTRTTTFGDGNSNTSTADATVTHTYATAGDYKITATGNIGNF